MEAKEIATLLTAIAAVIGAVGALINAAKMNSVKKEVSHNHGSSMKDAVIRIEERQKSLIRANKALSKEVSSLGHQIGEIRTDANVAHEDYAARLRRLESDK